MRKKSKKHRKVLEGTSFSLPRYVLMKTHVGNIGMAGRKEGKCPARVRGI